MNAIVVYESIYGNTRAVAEAVAEGLGGAPVLSVHEAADHHDQVDLLVVGGPTHMHGIATNRSRRAAAETPPKGEDTHVEASATEEPGMRSWLGHLSPSIARRAAAFDTRLDNSPLLTGSAARGIARRLRQHGFDVSATESFLVAGSEGPLKAGEVGRARAWGATLAGAPFAQSPSR